MKSRKSSDASSARPTSRRGFAKAVATTIVAAPIASSLARSQKSGTTKEATAPPNPPPAATPPKPSPLAEAYAEVARARFGERLTPEELEQVRKELEGNLQAAERLRAVKLRNEDEPDFIFSAE